MKFFLYFGHNFTQNPSFISLGVYCALYTPNEVCRDTYFYNYVYLQVLGDAWTITGLAWEGEMDDNINCPGLGEYGRSHQGGKYGR